MFIRWPRRCSAAAAGAWHRRYALGASTPPTWWRSSARSGAARWGSGAAFRSSLGHGAPHRRRAPPGDPRYRWWPAFGDSANRPSVSAPTLGAHGDRRRGDPAGLEVRATFGRPRPDAGRPDSTSFAAQADALAVRVHGLAARFPPMADYDEHRMACTRRTLYSSSDSWPPRSSPPTRRSWRLLGWLQDLLVQRDVPPQALVAGRSPSARGRGCRYRSGAAGRPWTPGTPRRAALTRTARRPCWSGDGSGAAAALPGRNRPAPAIHPQPSEADVIREADLQIYAGIRE